MEPIDAGPAEDWGENASLNDLPTRGHAVLRGDNAFLTQDEIMVCLIFFGLPKSIFCSVVAMIHLTSFFSSLVGSFLEGRPDEGINLVAACHGIHTL